MPCECTSRELTSLVASAELQVMLLPSDEIVPTTRGWLAVAQFRLSGRPSPSRWIIVTLSFSLPLMSLISAESRGVKQLQTCAVQQPRILPIHDLSFSKAAVASDVKVAAIRMNRRETARRDFMFHTPFLSMQFLCPGPSFSPGCRLRARS